MSKLLAMFDALGNRRIITRAYFFDGSGVPRRIKAGYFYDAAGTSRQFLSQDTLAFDLQAGTDVGLVGYTPGAGSVTQYPVFLNGGKLILFYSGGLTTQLIVEHPIGNPGKSYFHHIEGTEISPLLLTSAASSYVWDDGLKRAIWAWGDFPAFFDGNLYNVVIRKTP